MDRQKLLKTISSINVNKAGDRRAPHKPLLLLMAIANLQQNKHSLAFRDAEPRLRELLKRFAPPANRQQPELPYWHLRSDRLWEVDNAHELARQASGFPRIAALRETTGHLPKTVIDLLEKDPQLQARIVGALLEEHFPPSLHEDIIESVGLDVDDRVAEAAPEYVRKRRDPAFRHNVLRAYEHRCAVTGFRLALAGTYFGCEAAHVQWHAYDGPDTINNGLALEPTMHKLFDAGAWTLTDDRRVLVSAELTGADETMTRLRAFHLQPITPPLSDRDTLDAEFIRWHRESSLGGVFREPALPKR